MITITSRKNTSSLIQKFTMTFIPALLLLGVSLPVAAAAQTQTTNQAFTEQIFFKPPVKPKWPTVKQLFILDKDLEPFGAAWQQNKDKKITGITFQVKNNKDGATLGFTVSVKVVGSKGSITIFDTEDEGLDGGEGETYSFAFSNALLARIGPVVSAEISADSGNRVKETNEQNNKLTFKVVIVPLKKVEDEATVVAKVSALAKLLQPPQSPKFVTPPATEVVVNLPKPAAPVPPNKPTLSEPTNGGDITTVTPVLKWADNGPGKNYFRWYVLNPDSNQRVWERDWASGETMDGSMCANALNQWICQYATVPAGKLQFDQRYIWTVEANDGKLGSGYASSSEFNVKYEYVPVKFKAAPVTETTVATCPAGQNGPYEGGVCCLAGRFWNGSACVTD